MRLMMVVVERMGGSEIQRNNKGIKKLYPSPSSMKKLFYEPREKHQRKKPSRKMKKETEKMLPF